MIWNLIGSIGKKFSILLMALLKKKKKSTSPSFKFESD